MPRKRLAAMVLALLLVCTGALASFSPGLNALRAHLDASGVYEVSLGVSLLDWPDLEPSSLDALRGLLSGLQLKLAIAQTEGSPSQATLYQGEEELLSVHTTQDEKAASLTLSATGFPATTYVSSPQAPPGQLLLDSGPALPDLPRAQAAAQALAQAALPYLMDWEKPVKTANTIKNAGRGASQLVYALNKDEAIALWDTNSADLIPLLDALLSHILMGEYSAASAQLRFLRLTGPLTLKRILDKDGADLGLQLTAAIELDGKARRLSFIGGQSTTGAYLSLKLPATRGNDTLDVQISLATAPGNLKLDWRFTSRLGKESTTASGDVRLISKIEAGEERLSGSLHAKVRTTGSQPSNVSYTLKPDLRFNGLTASGTVQITQEMAGKTQRAMEISLAGQPLHSLPMIAQALPVDLSSLDEIQLLPHRARVQAALLPALAGFVKALPMEVRSLLLHDLGRVRRADAPLIALPLTELPSPYTVLPDTPLSQFKEENP